MPPARDSSETAGTIVSRMAVTSSNEATRPAKIVDAEHRGAGERGQLHRDHGRSSRERADRGDDRGRAGRHVCVPGQHVARPDRVGIARYAGVGAGLDEPAGGVGSAGSSRRRSQVTPSLIARMAGRRRTAARRSAGIPTGCQWANLPTRQPKVATRTLPEWGIWRVSDRITKGRVMAHACCYRWSRRRWGAWASDLYTDSQGGRWAVLRRHGPARRGGRADAVRRPSCCGLPQDGEIRRLGENRTRWLDVRVVAATNRPLAAEAAEGCFGQGSALPSQRRQAHRDRVSVWGMTGHGTRRAEPDAGRRLGASDGRVDDDVGGRDAGRADRLAGLHARRRPAVADAERRGGVCAATAATPTPARAWTSAAASHSRTRSRGCRWTCGCGPWWCIRPTGSPSAGCRYRLGGTRRRRARWG